MNNNGKSINFIGFLPSSVVKLLHLPSEVVSIREKRKKKQQQQIIPSQHQFRSALQCGN